MVRRLSRLVPSLLFLLILLGWPRPARSQAPSPLPVSGTTSSPAASGSAESLRRLNQMTPEERQKWLENSKRWKNMSKEERDMLRWQAAQRAQRMEKAVDDFIRKNGWNISPELRQQLLARYLEERRLIEETLRKEMDEKRRPMLQDMNERLKREFEPIVSAGAPAPSPAKAQTQP